MLKNPNRVRDKVKEIKEKTTFKKIFFSLPLLYIYKCIYTYNIYVYIYIYIRVYVYVYITIYVHTRTHICLYI